MQLVWAFVLIFSSAFVQAQTIFEVSERDNQKFAFIENLIPVVPGGRYRVINQVAEVVGTVEIVKITDKYFVGKVIEGQVQIQNFILTSAEPPTPATEFVVKEKVKPPPRKTLLTPSFGLAVGYTLQSMSFQAANNPPTLTESILLAGGSFTYTAFYEKPWKKTYTWRFSLGGAGFDGQYTAQNSGINSDGSNTSKFVAVSKSAGLAILWRWYESEEDTFHFWLGAGYTLHNISSYSTNLFSLRLAQPWLNSFDFGIGFESPINNDFFMPVSIWYASYYNGPGLTQSATSIGTGLGYRF
jgi:hypothetical protein